MINKKNINKVILIGHVGNLPTIRYTKEGVLVASFSLATHEIQNEIEHTEWHHIVSWGSLGSFVEENIKKGQLLYVEGKLKTRKWETKEGFFLSKTEILTSSVIPLDGRKQPSI